MKEEEGSTIVNSSAAHYAEHTTQIPCMNTEKILQIGITISTSENSVKNFLSLPKTSGSSKIGDVIAKNRCLPSESSPSIPLSH